MSGHKSELFYIHDDRPPSAFTKTTFSGYKIAQAAKKLYDTMVLSKIENACYWTAELVCAGHYSNLWETIFLFYGKHVHVANPKLAIYLVSKLSKFRENMNNAPSALAQLEFRNDPGFRRMFCEIVAVLCVSEKKFIIQFARVPEEDYDLMVLKTHLIAPDFTRGERVVQPDDPRELLVIVNEFLFNLSTEHISASRANHWLEWILEYPKQCKKRKHACLIQRREAYDGLVDVKHQRNVVWLVWDALLHEARTHRSATTIKVVESLLALFALRYTEVHNTRRKSLLYFATALLTNCGAKPSEKIELVSDKAKVVCVLAQVDAVFQQVQEQYQQQYADSGGGGDTIVAPASVAPSVAAGYTVVKSEPTSADKMRIISEYETEKRANATHR